MPKKKTGRPASTKTARKYIEAGLDPSDPDVRVQYHRWKKRQEAEDRKADKPASVPTADRRIAHSETMAPKFKGDPKLKEWGREISTLVTRQKEQRRGRRKADKRADDLFKQFAAAMDEAQTWRDRVESTQKRLTVLRELARKRRASMAAREYNAQANEIRKKLGLPRISIANPPK